VREKLLKEKRSNAFLYPDTSTAMETGTSEREREAYRTQQRETDRAQREQAR
jgi:hypothetical protein